MSGVSRAATAVAQPVGRLVGVDKPPSPPPAPAPAPAASQAAQTPERRASRSEEEMGARMRGARRRGRALLSDARLMGELGVETLGGGQNLG